MALGWCVTERPARSTVTLALRLKGPEGLTQSPTGVISVNENYVACRSLGHCWTHTPGAIQSATSGAVGKRSVCLNCGTERLKYIGRNGMLHGSRYTYPEGYSLHGEDRLAPVEWRSIFVASLFDPEPTPKRGRKVRAA